ncbi:MAG: hypothetical protein OXE40_15320 [Gammaproteobacteria bacterium]|nr:hypothetical protein [Gammaproteobacteria bacterium]
MVHTGRELALSNFGPIHVNFTATGAALSEDEIDAFLSPRRNAAALEKTIAAPVEPQLHLGDLRLLLFLGLFFLLTVADALIFRRVPRAAPGRKEAS